MGGARVSRVRQTCDWTVRSEEGIRYYSGTASYRKQFYLEDVGRPLWLDLGEVKELAEVRLNGKDLGDPLDAPVPRPDGPDRVPERVNELEVRVTNLWPNRLIGDAKLPPGKRLTRTNVAKFDRPASNGGKHALLRSGLLSTGHDPGRRAVEWVEDPRAGLAPPTCGLSSRPGHGFLLQRVPSDDVRDHALGPVTQQLGGRVTEHPRVGGLGHERHH